MREVNYNIENKQHILQPDLINFPSFLKTNNRMDALKLSVLDMCVGEAHPGKIRLLNLEKDDHVLQQVLKSFS
jgi:hypothetical protein